MNFTANSTEISSDIKTAYFCTLLSELCVGVTGNIMLLIVFRKMGPRSNIDCYIIFIAIIEIIVLLTTVPLYVIQKTDLWLTFGSELVCKLSHFEVQGLMMEVSILICIISMERVYAICKPSEIYIPRERVKYVILASSFAAFLASVPILVINWSVSEISCIIVPPLIFGSIFYAMMAIFFLAITIFILVSHTQIVLRIYNSGKRVSANDLRSKMANITTVDKEMIRFYQQNEITAIDSVVRRNDVRDQVGTAFLVRLEHIYVDTENPHVNVSDEDIYLKEGPEMNAHIACIKDNMEINHSVEVGFCAGISSAKTHTVQNKNSDVYKIQYPIENSAPNDDSKISVVEIKQTSENEEVRLGNIPIDRNTVTEVYLPGKVQEPPMGPSENNLEIPKLLETAFTGDNHHRCLNTVGDNSPENDGQKRSTGPGKSYKDIVILDRKQNPGNPASLYSKSRDQKANLFPSLNSRARKCIIHTTKLVFLLTLFHFSSWILDFSAFVLSFAFPGRFPVITMFLKPCYLINCCVNSFLYIGFDTEFRKTLYRLFCGGDRESVIS
ncbi:hypothetical protein CHS0354_019233 [Potamilus streckersoni]|uniref:G-protein coupled receptors family 1 profile domain-containing protein n=1 Tax=Potamilus streckersoni TaxID=2493646 RepID=A0AAE0W4L4_9BIVA|nr:hypothetical protein CHS0354_019233 [Potamilus streckersoni]